MKLSIVTINRNNAEGLRKTIESVLSQTYREMEYIIIDGASLDESVKVIQDYVTKVKSEELRAKSIIWVSEKDNGIYNAMNKGIEIALGRRVVNADHTSIPNSLNTNSLNESQCDYIQILNSGDILAAPDVTERMVSALAQAKSEELRGKSEEIGIPILYGNMVKYDYNSNKVIGKSKEVEYSLRQYYASTMNHDCCYIRRDVYDKYGLYDESLKIVSDWKWFLQAIGLGNVWPVYADIDVTIFDASGISETNLELRNKERRQVLEEVLPPAILADYDKYAFPMEQYNRLKKYHLWPIVYFMERVLFKLNKWKILR